MKKFSKQAASIIFLFCFFFPAFNLFSQPTGGESIFKQKCTSCHTIGGGKLVGPDLKGVTTRRDEAWLHKQIKEPDRMIAEGDPIATQLVKEMNGVPMAPLGLSDEEVTAIIEFLKSTEQPNAANVSTGAPAEYWPTILIGIAVLFLFTVIGMRAGKKQADVR